MRFFAPLLAASLSAVVVVASSGCDAFAAEGEGEGEGEGENPGEGEGEGEGENPGEGEGEDPGEGEGEGETTTPGLHLNEVGCTGTDFVELINTGDADVDLATVTLTDDVLDLGRRTTLSGTLAPGAFVVVDALSFGISCNDTVSLLIDGAVVEAADLASIARLPETASVGRVPDGSGAFVATTPSPGESNSAWVDPAAVLFGTQAPSRIDIVIDAAAEQSIRNDGYSYVESSITVTIGDDVIGPITSGLRKKGRIGSSRNFDQKMAFKLDFNRFVPEQTLLGLGKLNLNNLVQDNSAIHEITAYRLFAAVDVPAPRVGYVDVFVNGTPFGTYLAIEAADDPVYLDRGFTSTQAVFEGEYGEDFFMGNAPAFDLDDGDDSAYVVLDTFITALNTVPDADVYTALAPLIDWDEVLHMMATEAFIGHWDGYAPSRNNYFVHLDDDGVLSLMPWGVDQTFDDRRPLFEGAGLILQRCLSNSACRDAYTAALLDVADAADQLVAGGFDDEVTTLAANLVAVFADDPRREWNNNDIPNRAEGALNFIAERVAQCRADLTCPAGSDTDGDGYACNLDCNEGDPNIHFDALEVCGNDVDEDCSGLIDDRDECGECIDDVAGRPLRFCRSSRTYADAEAICADANMRLVSIASEADWDDVYSRARRRFGDAAFWLGLDDSDDEGTYVWSDGRTWQVGDDEPYARFAGGEPNNYPSEQAVPGEDCIHTTGDRWNDNVCEAGFAVICEPR